MPKGFTFVEIMIVIGLMAILAVAATTSSVNTQKQIAFIETYKSVLAKIQEGRTDAVSRLSAEDELNGESAVPEYYGVQIYADSAVPHSVTVFADFNDEETNPRTLLFFDNDCGSSGTSDYCDTTVGNPLNLGTNYEIEIIQPGISTPPSILNLFYAPPYGEFIVNDDAGVVLESNILVVVKDTRDTARKKCLIVPANSGIVEAVERQSPYWSTYESYCS